MAGSEGFTEVDVDGSLNSFEDAAGDEIAPVARIEVLSQADSLTVDDARRLTDTIRSAAEMLWILIMRAHQGRAWEALGYTSWEEYVRAEFNMSRSRSYQIIDQGRVIQAIEAVMPEGSEVVLSEAAARDLKGVLDDVLPQIAERTEGLAPTDAAAVLDEIVEEQRELIRAQPDSLQPGDSDEYGDDFDEYGGGRGGPAVDDFDEYGDDFDEYGGAGTGGGDNNGGGSGGFPDDTSDDLDEVDPIYGDTSGVDLARIRRNVSAGHDVYAALIALADLPENLDEVIDSMQEERKVQVGAKLGPAKEKLDRFAEIWAMREE